jgi:hypothetical protein
MHPFKPQLDMNRLAIKLHTKHALVLDLLSHEQPHHTEPTQKLVQVN